MQRFSTGFWSFVAAGAAMLADNRLESDFKTLQHRGMGLGNWGGRKMRQFRVFLLGTILLLVFVEGALRFASFVSHLKATNVTAPDEYPSAEGRLVRIVTMGESTTAESIVGGRRVDWPAQLESLLNRHFLGSAQPFRVKVFNIGRSATSSAFQVALLKERADEIDPDIVVSMLGVNDGGVIQAERNVLFRNSYLARFLYWAKIAWNCPRCYDVNLGGPISQVVGGLSSRDWEARNAAFAALAAPLTSVAELELFVSNLRNLQMRYGENQHWMNVEIAKNLLSLSYSPELNDRKDGMDEKLRIEAYSLVKSSYQMVLRDGAALKTYCDLSIGQFHDRNSCLQATKDALAGGADVTTKLLTTASYAGANNDPILRAVFLNAGFSFADESTGGGSVRNAYQQIGDFVRATGATWFAMQYPTGSIPGLKFYFSMVPTDLERRFSLAFYLRQEAFFVKPEFRDVIYVSNENFNHLVTPANASEYFVDFFGRATGLNFGHTTEKGHEVIAQNLAEQMLASWPKVIEAVDRRRGGGSQ